MEIDAKTHALVASISRLTKKYECPQKMKAAASYASRYSVQDRCSWLSSLLRREGLSAKERLEIRTEKMRIFNINNAMLDVKYELSELEKAIPRSITEKVIRDDTLYVLKCLDKILINLADGEDLYRGIKFMHGWLLDQIPQHERSTINFPDAKSGCPLRDVVRDPADKMNDLETFHQELVGDTSKGYSKAISTPEELVEELRAEGIINEKQLAAEVDKRSPKRLSFATLGRLLPARPGATVSYEAAKSQGQRLRGKKK